VAPGATKKKSRSRFRLREQPFVVEFPDDMGMPETRRHYEIRSELFQIMKLAFADRCSLGSSQFVYWNAADPARCIAPDLFVRVGEPDSLFACWKTWERGAPDIAVEIIGDSDSTELAWNEKLGAYLELGVTEVVRFDPVAPADFLRIWLRTEGDLVERQLDDPRVAESAVLDFTWVVVKDPRLGRMLRVAEDPEGLRLLPTPVEREIELRKALERRVKELEEQIAKRG
jgi:hypothetical protein